MPRSESRHDARQAESARFLGEDHRPVLMVDRQEREAQREPNGQRDPHERVCGKRFG